MELTSKISSQKRNTNIDFARGVAILIMILANSAPYLLINIEVPFWLRFTFSFAAPIFIFLSGYSLNLAFQSNKSIKKILIRPIQILFIAIVIDCFVWKIMPFQTFDVLYAIGISQLLLITIHNIKPKIKLLLLILALFVYALLTFQYDYRFHLIENELCLDNFKVFSINSSIRRMLFDGWFPLMPWFIVSLIGHLANDFNSYLIKNKYFFILGIILIISSYFLFLLFPNWINQPREKYLELFYPITLPYSCLLLGIFIIVITFINSKIKLNSRLNNIGRLSLFVYLIHVLIINYILSNFDLIIINPFITFFLIGILFIVTIFISCKIISLLKLYILKNNITKPILFLLGL